MKELSAVLWAEGLKVRKSKIFWATLSFFAFIALIMGLMMYVLQHPEIMQRSATLQTKSSFLDAADWKNYFGLLIQLILTLGTIGFGFVASWVFGREYQDKTIKDILALPVKRHKIVSAKVLIIFAWCLALTVVLFIFGLISGLIVNIPGWSFNELWGFLELYSITAIYNIPLVTIVCFLASIGRGYILPIAFTIFSLIITEIVFVATPSLTIYIPWGFPALVSGVAGETAPGINSASYIIYFISIISGFTATLAWWRYADQK